VTPTANIILCSHPRSDYPESTIHDTCDLGKQLEITQHEIPHECCTALESAARDECFPSATTHCDSQPSLYIQQTACRPNVQSMSPKSLLSLLPKWFVAEISVAHTSTQRFKSFNHVFTNKLRLRVYKHAQTTRF